jgi:predicted esterase
MDTVVPLAAAERAYTRLLAMGMQRVSLHSYPMAHSIISEELDAVVAWLAALPDVSL